MPRVFLVAAGRTAIAPKKGALMNLSFYELAAKVVKSICSDFKILPEEIDGFFLGNAMGAGGNPARLAALASGIPCKVPAWTIDTQCCSGLDAIGLAVDRIRAGSAHILLAGGAESTSQAPMRYWTDRALLNGHVGGSAAQEGSVYKSRTLDRLAKSFEEASFTPWAEQEPSMVSAAWTLSVQLADPNAECAWAVRSHERARASSHLERIVEGGIQDTFTRALTQGACRRASNHPIHNPATMAPLADGAAIVLLMSEGAFHRWSRNNVPHSVCEVLSFCQVGADPFAPGLATAALGDWLNELRAKHGEPDRVELMESFAAQALLNIKALELDPSRVNAGGGMLAMGHPIGASGAVLAARLHHQLLSTEWGVALIPAAGGLASGLSLQRIVVH